MMKFLSTVLLAILLVTANAQNTKPNRQLFDKKTIGEIRITLPVTNWVDALDSMRLYGDTYMQGSIQIDGASYDGASVRFRGDKSYQKGEKRNPFAIKLNKTNPDQNHQGYSSLKLSSALRDPSMVREVLFHEIAGKYMPSSQTAYTKVYVNNEYIGIFINIESIDRQFLTKHYKSAEGSLFKAGNDYKPTNTPTTCKQNIFGALEYESDLACYKANFEAESGANWPELQELTQVLSQSPSTIERILDVDRVLWMHALNNVMVNLNSYAGNYSVNYFLYKDSNGRFQPVHWDLNLGFGSYKNTGSGSDLEIKDLQNLDPLLHEKNNLKPLISVLLRDPFYKKIYLSHVKTINEENFSNNAYEKRAQELQGMIVVPFNDDKNKAYTLEDFQNSLRQTVGKRSKIPGIVEIMSKRALFLKKHPELTALPSSISDIAIKSRGKLDNKALSTFNITARADRFPKRLLIYYKFNENDVYTVMPMNEETVGNLPAGVKAFSASIEPKNGDTTLYYYLLAENAGTVTFSPGDYTQKPIKIKLSDLNK